MDEPKNMADVSIGSSTARGEPHEDVSENDGDRQKDEPKNMADVSIGSSTARGETHDDVSDREGDR
jgi:hypothetical protein